METEEAVALGRGGQSVPCRRKEVRHQIEAEVHFHDETNFYTGFSENVSSGGVFIATYNLIEIGRRVHVSLSLPSGEVVEVAGRVRWMRSTRNSAENAVSPGIGIEFENLTSHAQKHIEEFVAQREPLFYD